MEVGETKGERSMIGRFVVGSAVEPIVSFVLVVSIVVWA